MGALARGKAGEVAGHDGAVLRRAFQGIAGEQAKKGIDA